MPREKGTKNGEGVTVVAPIKNWKPWMTTVIIKHIAGLSHEEIAKDFPSKKDPSQCISTGRISQIINDPRGQQMIKGLGERIKEDMLTNIEDKLLRITEKSVDRIAETIEAEFTPGTQAKKHQDDVSLTLAKNFLPGEKEARAANSRPPISEQQAERFIKALERANEARSLNSGKEIIIEEEKSDAA